METSFLYLNVVAGIAIAQAIIIVVLAAYQVRLMNSLDAHRSMDNKTITINTLLVNRLMGVTIGQSRYKFGLMALIISAIGLSSLAVILLYVISQGVFGPFMGIPIEVVQPPYSIELT